MRPLIYKQALVISILALGCATDDETVVELGIIEHFGQPAVIETPSLAAVGAPILVNVHTFGDGCVSADRTDVLQDIERVDVSPFDRRRIPGQTSCPAILLEFTHEVSVTFDTPGDKTIRVYGRHVDVNVDELVEIDIALTVQ